MKPRAVLFVGACLSACAQSEPRNVQYFEVNPDEAREAKAECQDGSIRSRECDNADIALQVIEGRERFARFRGKK